MQMANEIWLPCSEPIRVVSVELTNEWYRNLIYVHSRTFQAFDRPIPTLPFDRFPYPPMSEIMDAVQLNINRLDDVVRPLRAHVESAATLSGFLPAPTQQRCAERFQLTLSDHGEYVEREGKQLKIRLRPLFKKLFLHFLERGEVPTNARWFGEHWGHFGKKRTTRRGTIDGAITGLNYELRRLDLELFPELDARGWVLRELQPT